MYQPNRYTHLPTNPLTECGNILTTEHWLICTNTTNTHTYPQSFTCRNHRAHRHVLNIKYNSYVPTQQIYTPINQNTDIFIQLNIDTYVPTKQKHIRTNKPFTLCIPIASATLGAAPIMDPYVRPTNRWSGLRWTGLWMA